MATSLKLDYGAASTKARVVELNADQIKSILDNLIEDVRSNVNNKNVWSGVSADSFLAKWNECSDTFNSFVTHIKNIQAKIDYTANEVQSFDTNM